MPKISIKSLFFLVVIIAAFAGVAYANEKGYIDKIKNKMAKKKAKASDPKPVSILKGNPQDSPAALAGVS